jgi:hypothetical protein
MKGYAVDLRHRVLAAVERVLAAPCGGADPWRQSWTH